MSQKRNITRRRFLKTAAGVGLGAAGFPYIVASSALGKAGTIAPSNRIVMGCIGVAGRGTDNMKTFMANPDVQMVAVCDVDARRRGPARDIVNKNYGNTDCAAYNDFRELLAREDIDAVMIATPDHWHGLIAIAAAKAGKDIYCEKALTNTIAEGRAVCDAVKRYGRVLQTGSQERSGHNARFACELIRNGRIGKLHTIRVNLPLDGGHSGVVDPEIEPTPRFDYPPEPVMPVPEHFDYDMWLGPRPWAPYTYARVDDWRLILDYGGGEMTDRGAHVIDIAQLGNGTDDTGPVEITGRGRAPRRGLFNTFITFQFECKYASGVRMIGRSRGNRGVKFEGTAGWVFIHIHGGRLDSHPKSLLKEFIGPNEIHLGRNPGHHRNFLDSVRTRRQPAASAEVGHRTASICHLVNIAMLTERRLKWDPQREQITNDPHANRMLARPMRSPWYI